jgi:hypothetical protein
MVPADPPGDDAVLDPPEPDASLTGEHEAHTTPSASIPTEPTTNGDRLSPATDAGDNDALRPMALERALREVDASVDLELVELLDKLESFRTREEDLQSQLEELYLQLGTLQDALSNNSKELRTVLQERIGFASRRYEQLSTTMQRVLTADAARLMKRDALFRERQKTAEDRVRAFQENPQLAEQIAEFKKLDERMDTLDLLPESYRGVVQEHHATLKKKLSTHLEEPAPVQDELLRLGIAVGVRDGTGGEANAGAIRATLPCYFDTHARARQGKGDLAARFAFRMLAALSRLVVNIGASSEPEARSVQGLLGIELAFEDLDFPVSAADLARALREAFEDVPDVQMARVRVSAELMFVPCDAVDRLWKQGLPEEEEPKTSGGKRKRARK